MPFRFAYVCNLLEKLHHIFARHPPYLPRDVQQMSARVVTLWFRKHELKIKNDIDGFLLLSNLLPEKHVDKVYGLSERDLAKVVGRAFSLSTAEFDDILHTVNPGDPSDLGHRVEHVTKQCDILAYSRAYDTSIEEIDRVLALVASQHSFASHPSQSHLQRSFSALNDKLGPLYRCLTPRERKWLTRLVLKSYAPIVMPEYLIFNLYHPLLPGLVRGNFDLKAALRFISRLEADPALPVVNAEDSEVERGLANATAVAVAANTADSGVNDKNVGLRNSQNVPPLIQGAGSCSQSFHMLTVSMPSNAQSIRRGKPGSTTSPSKKRLQPLSDMTKRGVRKSPVRSQTEESSAGGRTTSQLIRRMSLQAEGSVHGGSPTKLQLLKAPNQHNVCPKEGKHCLFHKKDVGLFPSVFRSAKLTKLLAKHQVVALNFKSFLKNGVKCNTSKDHRRRRMLLVDRNLHGVEAAVENIRALPSHDRKGRKQWVDIYDWRLLEYVDKHESCRDSKLECMRRNWIGTV